MDRYCVIGNPIGHSRSPDIHAAFAAATGQALQYERCLAPLDGFAGTVRTLLRDGYRGANVTVPFKLQAYELADVRSERAEAAGAVNTLVFADGQIRADNTDGAGLVNDIVKNARVDIRGKRVLMLGAGGAVQGCILPILQQEPASVTIVNRTRASADALAARFAAAGTIAACDYADLIGAYDIVINGTSASLGGDLPPVPAAAFGAHTLALDMMYGKEPSPFMAFAREQGASVRDGLGMLVEQAAEAFFLWRGVRPATDAVLTQIRSNV
jgi:shikimate dehydrogenase